LALELKRLNVISKIIPVFEEKALFTDEKNESIGIVDVD